MYFLIFIAVLLLLFFLISYRGKDERQENILEDELTGKVHQKDKNVSSHGINKTSSTAIDFKKITIPKYRQELLYISQGEPLNTGLSHSIHIDITNTGVESETHGPDEPSAIFIKQPIKKPENPNSVQELGYFPSYAQMNPFQKWIYLDWLCDVTKPIDTGYVFTYYYGLERRLINGQFEEAFKEINLLREHHKNNSFQSYSLNALINAINIKKRFGFLESICIDDDYDKIGNSALYISYKLEFDLHSDVLISIVNSISGTNRRYIKKNRNIYKEILEEVLTEKYSTDSYPFTKIIDINNVKRKEVKGFANYSLVDEYSQLSYPNFLGHKKFTSDVLLCHKEAHERTKKKLRELRKRRKNT
jgi:hypothetical protein